MYGPRPSTGSGCVISGQRILTNAHVVSDQTFIQVRRHGESRRFTARVLEVSHDSDLAILTVDEPEFFKGVIPLDLGNLPKVQQEVVVYGFPLGGDTLSTTKGVVSRIEHQTYVHSSQHLFAVQIDAAINPGNSGGPVIYQDKIVGVVMQSARGSENIGYIVPVPIIKHFFDDIIDNKYDGFPALGIVVQQMENPALKTLYNVPEKQTGVLIASIAPGSPADLLLKPGDIITNVDGFDVENDGTIEFRRRERTSFSHIVQLHQVGENLNLKILRDGEPKNIELPLKMAIEDPFLVSMQEYDVMPDYYIYGGVVFTPLTKSLLMSYGKNWYSKAPNQLVSLLDDYFKEKPNQEIVLVLKVLDADVNRGYNSFRWWPVESVNGIKVNNLRQLIETVEKKTEDSKSEFTVFVGKRGKQIVLNRKDVQQSAESILKIYRVPVDRYLSKTNEDK